MTARIAGQRMRGLLVTFHAIIVLFVLEFISFREARTGRAGFRRASPRD